ncbi:MAG: S8 family serine peptidase [Nannocystales bacterium]
MRWTHITKVVTKRGVTLKKTQVRDWLISRGALGRDQEDRLTVTIAVGDFTLRTPEEVKRWLLKTLGCRTVRITEPERPGPNRVVALGRGHNNRNVAPLEVRWVQVTDGARAAIERIDVRKGTTARIAVIVNQNVRAPYTVELCYVGAKLGQRPATRSVTETPYRYLSRVRMAEDAAGIENPLRDLETGATVLPCDEARWKIRWQYKLMREFTVVGLETGNGPELIEATLLGRDGVLLHRSVLRVNVTAPANPVGAFAAFSMANADAFAGDDAWFSLIQDASSDDVKADEAKIGVCDTGVFDDELDGNYLKPRMVGAKYFHSIPNPGDDDNEEDGDRDRVTVDDGDLLLDEPSKHGTNVAAQASYGSGDIKILDLMVQKGQTLGAITPAATARAFNWAADQGVCVVNCSKILPFREDAVQAVVNHNNVRNQVLFLATGSNEQCSFPFFWNEIRNAHIQRSTVGEAEVPRNPHNTLFVGGCMQNGSKHASRGYGPGIDVMVPSDQTELYTPKTLLEAFRLPQIHRFRTSLRTRLQQCRQRLANEPNMVQGQLNMVERNMVLPDLERRERAQKLSERQRLQLQEFRNRTQLHANPLVALRGGYDNVLALLDDWDWPDDDLVANCDTVLGWVRFLQALTVALPDQNIGNVNVDDAWDDDIWGRIVLVNRRHRDTINREIIDEMQVKGVVPTYQEVLAAQNDYTGLAGDKGVSFGLPVVANIAAKLKLLRAATTSNATKRVLIDTSDYTRGFEGHCLAKGIVNPLRAYFAVFDNVVAQNGTDPRVGGPAVSDDIEAERRLYYSVFCMDDEGQALYDAVKAELKQTFAASNVDLIEAEPPIRIPSEIHTYVTDQKIARWNWKNIVDLQHGLTHAPRHIRIILASQSATPLGAELHNVTWHPDVEHDDEDNPRWATPNPDTYQPPFGGPCPYQSELLDIAQDQDAWTCRIQLRHPEQRIVLPHRLDHIIEELRIGDIPTQTFRVRRVNDHRALVTVPVQGNEALQQHADLRLKVRVVQELGGNRDGKNIFVNTNYLSGTNGTAAARRSTLVLLMHEIGHCLGMVPTNANLHYDQTYGGEGDHCGHNTTNVANDLAVNYGIPADGVGGQVKVPIALTDPDGHGNDVPCVMYHTRSAAHHRSRFCAACVDAIRDSDEGQWLA